MAYERLTDKDLQLSDEDMIAVIGSTLSDAWTELRRFLVDTYEIEPYLQYGGQRFGWNVQHRKGGRPLCEMYPEHGSFTAMVVLGAKEWEEAVSRLDTFGDTVRRALTETPRHRDGCWMYTRISDPETCHKDAEDIAQLILIKHKPPKKKSAS